LNVPSLLHDTVDVHTEAFEGSAPEGMLTAASSADLVVVGARRRHRSFGMQLGPVSHALLHHAACPVAIIPQTA
jgi:nucleotide-binding universal stress UspA family protein